MQANAHAFPVVSMWYNHIFDGKSVAEYLQYMNTQNLIALLCFIPKVYACEQISKYIRY